MAINKRGVLSLVRLSSVVLLLISVGVMLFSTVYVYAMKMIYPPDILDNIETIKELGLADSNGFDMQRFIFLNDGLPIINIVCLTTIVASLIALIVTKKDKPKKKGAQLTDEKGFRYYDD